MSTEFSFSEGDSFADRFTMLHRVSEDDSGQCWLISRNEETLRARLFRPAKTTGRWPDIVDRIHRVTAQPGPLHASIARIIDHGSWNNVHYWITEPRDISRPLDLSLPLKKLWPALSELIDVLDYIHSLGLADGFLCPEKLFLNSENHFLLVDFQLPVPFLTDSFSLACISPQIKQGSEARATDDIFSLGQILHFLLTGVTARAGISSLETDSPVDPALGDLILRMLSGSPDNRPGLAEIRRCLDSRLEENKPTRIISPDFRRPDRVTENRSPTPIPHDTSSIRISTALTALGIILIGSLLFFTLYTPPEITSRTIDNQGSSADIEESKTRKSESVNNESAGTGPWLQARQEQARIDAEKLAEEIIRRQISLENKGAMVWAPGAIQQSYDLSEEADRLFRGQSYLEALENYQTAMQLLNETENAMTGLYQDHMEKGRMALESGNWQQAIESFTILSSIEPDNGELRKQLERAENLQQVTQLTRQAETHEYNDELEEALNFFESAVKIDQDWQPARHGVARINNRLAELSYSKTMSDGFEALSANRFTEARKAFQQAANLMPEREAPHDALIQVDVAERNLSLGELSSAAREREAKEDWQGAMDLWHQITQIDDTLSLARSGKQTAESRLKLDNDLNTYISRPELMQNDTGLSSARELVKTAYTIENPGPALKKQMSELSLLINMARIPVPLTIQSDNKTEITIYKVGKFGTFTEKQVELIPGTYTLLGKRAGYMDVRKNIVLTRKRDADSLFLACEEKIGSQ